MPPVESTVKNNVLECNGLSHWFGDNLVLHELNFGIERGSIVSLVGPSGCGKSTLLRAIVGTHPPCKGELIVHPGGGEPGKHVKRPGRDRGIVYQRYSLYPFLTAVQNVALGLMLDETSLPFRLFQPLKWWPRRKAHLTEATELLVKIGLSHAVHRYPSELSGGMNQRVAIAQALIMKPRILLLDEPFGALDEATREELQEMLLTLYAENQAAKNEDRDPPYTILIVTHELNEAIYVGSRVLGLSQYWDWKGDGHARGPGATIVYDQPAPVFDVKDTRNFELFREQRETIRHAVFETTVLQPRMKFHAR